MTNSDYSGCVLNCKTANGCNLKRNGSSFTECRFCDIVPMYRTLPAEIKFEDYEILKEAANIDGVPIHKAAGQAIHAFIQTARHGMTKRIEGVAV